MHFSRHHGGWTREASPGLTHNGKPSAPISSSLDFTGHLLCLECREEVVPGRLMESEGKQILSPLDHWFESCPGLQPQSFPGAKCLGELSLQRIRSHQ